VAENGERARARAVVLADTVFEDVLHEVVVWPHALYGNMDTFKVSAPLREGPCGA
jgi:hypothetical protein